MGAFESGFEIGLTDEIDKMLKNGEWKRRTGQLSDPDTEKVISPWKMDIAESAKTSFLINTIFENFDFENQSDRTIEEISGEFYQFFHTGRLLKAYYLLTNSNVLQRIASTAVQTTTITDAHVMALNQFDFYSREMGKVLPGSTEYKKAKEQADFWSRSEEVSRGAVEYAIREGLEH